MLVSLWELANRMLKTSASGVLASRRVSTYRSVRFASSLAAALLDGIFEHPGVCRVLRPSVLFQLELMPEPSFSAGY